MRTEPVEMTLSFRQDRDRAIAVWDGRSWTSAGREVWTWLPKSQISYRRRERDVVVRLPEWLARRKSLADRIARMDAKLDAADARLASMEARLARIEQQLELAPAHH